MTSTGDDHQLTAPAARTQAGVCVYCGLDHTPAGPSPACIAALNDELHVGWLIVAALGLESDALAAELANVTR